MKILFYDPDPKPNPWLAFKFFAPMFAYGKTIGMDVSISDTLDVNNSIVILHAQHLTPASILKLKNNNNKICSFDVNDSSWLSDTYSCSEEAKFIDIIFKFAGIQKTESSSEIQIDEDLNFAEWDRPFAHNKVHGEIYNYLRDNNKLVPMPHIGFYHYDVKPIPIGYRIKKVLVRGGNRYLRYLLFLQLMRYNLADEISAHFFRFTSDKSFNHCAECVEENKKYKRISYDFFKKFICNGCSVTNNLPWVGNDIQKMAGLYQPKHHELWNDKCIPLYYWLAEKFNAKYGGINMDIVDKTLNQVFVPEPNMLDLISMYTFYGDYKWIFSIDIPPRFWQAANAGSVNIMPKWTSDQTHFPELLEDEHYVSYSVKMDNVEELAEIDTKKLQYISDNTKAVYDKWIKPGKTNLSDNLLKYIYGHIDNI